jgi:hypothetical protein
MNEVVTTNGRLLSLLTAVLYTSKEVMLKSAWHKEHVWNFSVLSKSTPFQSFSG